MIDLFKVGAYLSHLRKSKDLTQAELAEQLNISHQAVSKWERGESMPDVGMLPRIAALFGITVDDLLRGEPAALPARAEEIGADAMPSLHMSEKEQGTARAAVAATAQLEVTNSELPQPAAAEEAMKHRFQTHDIKKLAPFLEKEILEQLIIQQAESDRIDWHLVKELAPFIGQQTLKLLADRIASEDTLQIGQLKALAPFLDKETIDQLVQQAEEGSVSWDVVQGLAPFIRRETMDRLVNRVADGQLDAQRIVNLAPFLGKDRIRNLLNDVEPESLNPDVLVRLAPFVDKATLGDMVKRLYGLAEATSGE